MIKYDFETRPIDSTLPFWRLVSNEFKNIKISYANLTQARNWGESSVAAYLEQTKDTDLYILDYSAEACYTQEQWLSNHFKGKNFLNLTCDPFYFFKDHETTTFLPSWYYDVYYTNKSNAEMYRNQCSRNKKQYAVSCLNRAVKLPRIYNLVRLHKQGLLDDPRLLMTFKHYDVYIKDHSLPPNDDKRIIYPQDIDWLPLRNDLDDNEITSVKHAYTRLFYDMPINPLGEDLSKVLDDHTLNHPAYLDSHANLITESITYNVFYTEKTFKTLAAGIPFWLQGGANSCLFLDLFGFDTFKDLDPFSYNHYDREHSFVKKTNIISSMVSSFIKEEKYAELSLSDRIANNQEMFYSDKTYNIFFNHVVGKIRKLIA